MKKRFLALLCALVMLLAAIPSVSALSGEQPRAADTLSTLGIVKGTGGVSGYALTGSPTRAQAVTILLRLNGSASTAAKGGNASPFTDVPAWAKNATAYAYAAGWVTGTTPATFSPSAPVSGNAFCAMLLRMLGYSDAEGDFTVSGAAEFARHIGLTTQDYSIGTFTRGDLFELACSALTFSYQNSTQTVVERLIEKGAVTRSAANALGLLDTALTARQIADRCTAAMFQLDTYSSQEYIDTQTPSASASGFFISSDGLAVTNYHAISGVLYATATLSTGESYPVSRVLYYDADIDIAVIRISTSSTKNVKTSGFAYLKLAGTEDLRTGDAIFALGSPLGLGLSISSGIVSDPSRVVDRYALPCIMGTADISQGSSGGALLNIYGQVIGVTSGAYTYGNSMYLAVPIDPVTSADLSVEGQTLPEVAAIQAVKDAAAQAAKDAAG